MGSISAKREQPEFSGGWKSVDSYSQNMAHLHETTKTPPPAAARQVQSTVRAGRQLYVMFSQTSGPEHLIMSGCKIQLFLSGAAGIFGPIGRLVPHTLSGLDSTP